MNIKYLNDTNEGQSRTMKVSSEMKRVQNANESETKREVNNEC